MNIKILYILVCLIILTSCDLFKKQQSENIVARVNEHILLENQLAEQIPDNLSKEDSIIFTKSFIDQWAMDKIILDRAKFNLPVAEQKRYNEMVNQYKSELYKKAYLDALLSKQVDSIIDSIKIHDYYDKHKAIFKINEHLLKLRYVYIKNNLKDFKKIKESFKRFDVEDHDYLTDEQLKFDKIKLNDSVWVKSLDVYRDLKGLSSNQHKNLLSKNRYIEIQDSLGTYFIYVKDVLKPNSDAPISYIKPTIEQILKNKKNLEVKSAIKKQILKDAIKNNDYEIFK